MKKILLILIAVLLTGCGEMQNELICTLEENDSEVLEIHTRMVMTFEDNKVIEATETRTLTTEDLDDAKAIYENLKDNYGHSTLHITRNVVTVTTHVTTNFWDVKSRKELKSLFEEMEYRCN